MARNESFLFTDLVVVASEMSSKVQSRPAENGEHPRSKMENGTDGGAAPTLSTYTPEEMVQQMKELITENNELKGECQCRSVWKCKRSPFCFFFFPLPLNMNSVFICPCRITYSIWVAFTVQATL